MYVRRNIRASLIARFTWPYLIFYTAYGLGTVWVFHFLEHIDINISMPFLPLSVIGIAVAFYVGFKNSQAYDRFWEARKVWGGIVNYSRTWANQVMSFVSTLHHSGEISDEELYMIRKEMIYRHIAWLNALRINLRKKAAHSINHKKSARKFNEKLQVEMEWHDAIECFVTKSEGTEVVSHKNPPAQIIRHQGERLKELVEQGLVDDFRHMEMMRVLEEFYNLQGKCERIKNTPFPRQYAFMSKIFTWIFVLLLPLGLTGEFSKMGHSYIFLSVPFFILIAWIFMSMERIGDNSEDPFEGTMNDVPMTALCRMIEIDLREMLGETELPEKIQPVHDILL